MMEVILSGLSFVWFELFVPYALPAVSLWLGLRLRAFINSKTSSENIKSMMNIAIVAVEATEKEYVDQIRKAHEDGVVTDEEKKLASNMAINRFKSVLMSELGKSITNEDAKTFIEAALKLSGRSLRFDNCELKQD